MRTHVILAVFKRNFRSYFSGVIGYLFIVAFVGLGSFLAFTPQFFGNNLANLDQLNRYFPVLLLFIVPAITMSAWADERKLGTDELLFTLPATDFEIMLGKYLAVLGVYTVALLFSLSHVVVLMILGSPDLGLMFTTYLGYWVAGAALLSAGMVASILTNSATVAYVLGTLICAVPVFIDMLAPSNRLLQNLSLEEQFRDFGLGMIPLGGLLYFLSLTGLMLYINLVFISRRHWQGGPHRAPMGLHFLCRTVALAVILVGLNVVAANATSRIDLTSEQLYSLSPTTTKLLGDLKPERPVLVQAFISPEVPREYAATRSTLVGLLRQFDQAGGNTLRVRIVNTERFTDAADEAERYGIVPQEVQSERGGRFVREDVYMGVVVTSGVDDEVVVPFFDVGTPVEYELTRSVRTVSSEQRRQVGVLKTDAQVIGGFDMQAFRQLPEWRIVTELKKQYEVKEVTPEELAASKFDVLLAVMPSSLSEPELNSLVEYVKQGHPTLIIDDPFPRFHVNLAPRSPKPRPGGMFGGGPPPTPKAFDGAATPLMRLLNVAWNHGETVWDGYNPHPEFGDLFNLYQIYNVVYISAGSGSSMPFNDKSEIASKLQEIMLFYPGSIQPREGSKLEFEPLLRTSAQSTTLDWDEYVSSGGPFGGMQLVSSPRLMLPSPPVEHVVAARIKGTPADGAAKSGDDKAAGPEIDVVFISDLDMISNEFFFIRDKQWQGLQLDNITFVLNSVDVLAGDESFVALRKRRAKHRTLTTVEAQTEGYIKDQIEEASKADSEAKKQLAEAKKRFADERDRIAADTTMDDRTKQIRLLTAQENESRRVEVEEANIQNAKEKKIKESKDRSERAVRSIENRIRWFAIAIPPIPALLLGIFVLAVRVREERQGIVPDRLVTKRS